MEGMDLKTEQEEREHCLAVAKKHYGTLLKVHGWANIIAQERAAAREEALEEAESLRVIVEVVAEVGADDDDLRSVHAIKVFADDGECLGYLPTAAAAALAKFDALKESRHG